MDSIRLKHGRNIATNNLAFLKVAVGLFVCAISSFASFTNVYAQSARSHFMDPKESMLVTVATVGVTQNITTEARDSKTPVNFSQQQDALAQHFYQVHSTKLTPGKVSPQAGDFKTHMKPIAIVGCDDASTRWLKFYGDKLKALHAIGFVVNCAGQGDFNALQKVSSVKLMPFNGDLLAKRFKAFHLKHYPVLITQNYLTQ
jgi:integrating conjugative element protein (TIGR03765 family)